MSDGRVSSVVTDTVAADQPAASPTDAAADAVVVCINALVATGDEAATELAIGLYAAAIDRLGITDVDGFQRRCDWPVTVLGGPAKRPADWRPAEVFSPGSLIAEELEARGWNPDDLDSWLCWSEAKVAALLDGSLALSADDCDDLATALGTSARLWLCVEDAWRKYGGHDRGTGD